MPATFSYWPQDRSEPLIEKTIGEVLQDAARTWGPRIALVDGVADTASRRRWSFLALAETAEQVAGALLNRFSPGEHIAVWAANSPEWLMLAFGAALAGLTLVPVNPAYLADEMAYVLRQSRAAGLFVQDRYRGQDLPAMVAGTRDRLPDLRESVHFSAWASFLQSGSAGLALPGRSPHDIAQIQYTSGTTGFPKGAQLTHRGLANNGRLFARAIGAREEDVWINPMPLFHTAGCGLAALGALQTGGCHILLPGFDPALTLDLVASERGTLLLSVPTMLIRMLDEAARKPRDLASWRLAALGGAPVALGLVRRAREELRLKVAIGYGQTEASPYVTHTLPDDPNPDWARTVGRPLPQTEVKIVDPVTKEILRLGEMGEICTRGYGVMKGYFGHDATTTAALDEGGWLHTGDIGSMDGKGYCRVQGRLKDMIIRGGENIYPREIEDVLLTHPSVANVSVIGLPDEEWGEIVAAFVQLRPGCVTKEQELAEFCRARLAAYKTPRLWRFVENFPQTGSGKIQKFALRQQFLREHGQLPGAASSPVS